MRTIEPIQSVGGYTLTLLHRPGDIAVFDKRKLGHTRAHSFEVVRIRRHDGFNISGRVIPPSEYLPRAEEFGVHGFDCLTLDDACRRAAAMEKEIV